MTAYPSFGGDWRKRWVQMGHRSVTLHRVASVITPSDEARAQARQDSEGLMEFAGGLAKSMGRESLPVAPNDLDDWEVDGYIPIGIQGETACGRSGRLSMPGVFSRMGAPRCKRCCRKTGVPPGNGAPFNDKPLRQRFGEC